MDETGSYWNEKRQAADTRAVNIAFTMCFIVYNNSNNNNRHVNNACITKNGMHKGTHAHTHSQSNPHSVTAIYIGLYAQQ